MQSRLRTGPEPAAATPGGTADTGECLGLLALLNPSKACLSMSAVMAGYCLFRFYAYTAGNLLVLPYLFASGALLGMADSAWRAIFAAAADFDEKADALAGAGLISTAASYLTAVFTTLAGLMCAMTGGYNTFRAAGLLVLLMLGRSALFRSVEILTPLLKGLTWGVLLIIGMTAHPSFTETLYIGETRVPALFFTFYMVVAAVLVQARDTYRPRPAPADEEQPSATASRLLELREDSIEYYVVLLAGGTLVLIPLALAWILPWRWLSWAILIFLAGTTLARLIPVLAYRTRRDLATFTEAAFRGGALLNAGAVATLGDYRVREIYREWTVSMPGQDELAAIALIAALAVPAWMLRRAAPLE